MRRIRAAGGSLGPVEYRAATRRGRRRSIGVCSGLSTAQRTGCGRSCTPHAKRVLCARGGQYCGGGNNTKQPGPRRQTGGLHRTARGGVAILAMPGPIPEAIRRFGEPSDAADNRVTPIG